ncbi:glycosyltransferase family 87 protein [Leptospira sp. 96542]|nr:glycosyltransferase family 87 protein [Leptospira sp. 96542]
MWKFLDSIESRGKWIVTGLFLVLLVLSITRSGQKSDFLDYYNAANRWSTGENLYRFDVALELQKIQSMEELFHPENLHLLTSLQNETATYIYPPLFSFLLIPLSALESKYAALVFEVLSFFCLIGVFYLLQSKLGKLNSISKYPYVIFTLTLLFNFRYIESHIQNNQVGILLILLILIALTTEKDYLAGTLLALAVSIKITPLVFLFVFVYEKRTKAFVWFFIFILVWNAIPLAYNFDYTFSMTKEWITQILGNAFSNPILRSWKNNQSLVSTLAKYFVTGADFINQPDYGMPFINLSVQTIKFIQFIFVIFFGIPILMLWKLKDKKWEIISLLFIVSAIFSGISWVHSYIVCIVPIYYLVNHLTKYKWERMQIYIFVTVCLLPLVSHRTIIGSKLEQLLSMYSILLYSVTSLYILFVYTAFNKYENRH